MYYSSTLLALLAAVSTANAHGVILKAVGDGKSASQGFLVDQTLARNCTTISPCQQDSVIIRDAEITQNIVNECGRTEIAGNIDVGAETENELAAGRMATVAAGGVMKVTIHQVNADGAGPYECDLDQTNNAGPGGNIPLKVTNNIPGVNGLSQNKEQDFTINVQMPANMNCIGASTGDICTVRCRNQALAGPFGGCFAVQQTGGAGRQNSSAAAVTSAQAQKAVQAQILQNQKDLPVAIAANQAAGALAGAQADGDNEAGIAAINALLSVNPATVASSTAAAGNAAATAAAGNNNKGKGKGNGKANGNANANAGNANAAAGNANAATGQAAAGNANAATGNNNNKNGNANAAAGQAATGNANAATGQAATGNANAATGQAATGNANAATGQAATGKANKNGNANAATAAAGNGQGGKTNKLRRSAKFLIRD